MTSEAHANARFELASHAGHLGAFLKMARDALERGDSEYALSLLKRGYGEYEEFWNMRTQRAA